MIISKTRSNNPTMAVWSWRDKSDMLMVERIAKIKSNKYSSRQGTKNLSHGSE